MKNINFQKPNLFLRFLSHWVLCQSYVSMTRIMNFGPIGPFCSFAPMNSINTDIFSLFCFFQFSLSFWAYLPRIMFLWPKLWLWPLMAPFAIFKRAPKHMNIYKNNVLFIFSFVMLSLLAKNYVSITKTATFGPLGPFLPIF